jgi:choline dehydrogenase-like flavoprotein
VVACSAVETARLLLLSRSRSFPDGLGNTNGLVGKNVVFSGQTKGEAMFKMAGREDAWLHDHAPFVQRSLQDLYLLDKPKDGVRKVGSVVFSLAHPNPIFTAERVAGSGADARWGRDLKKALREEARGARTLTFESFGEFLPNPGTYVDLDPEVKDRWGVPVARISLSQHPQATVVNRLLAERGKAVLDALGPDTCRVTRSDGPDMVLQGGTCRFGRDRKTSVLDVDCRAHDVPNLYVTDSSFMPTSGGVPPTLTILANAFRVGARIAARLKAGEI